MYFKDRIEKPETENKILKIENQRLKKIINKNSNNSSKPPSRDIKKKIENKEIGGRNMKIGIISDIHGNIEALNVVLKMLEKEKVEKIICLGDLIGRSRKIRRSNTKNATDKR